MQKDHRRVPPLGRWPQEIAVEDGRGPTRAVILVRRKMNQFLGGGGSRPEQRDCNGNKPCRSPHRGYDLSKVGAVRRYVHLRRLFTRSNTALTDRASSPRPTIDYGAVRGGTTDRSKDTTASRRGASGSFADQIGCDRLDAIMRWLRRVSTSFCRRWTFNYIAWRVLIRSNCAEGCCPRRSPIRLPEPFTVT